MTNYDEFIKSAGQDGFRIQVANGSVGSIISGDNLFHAPILALTILITANTLRQKDLNVSEVSTWTGAVLTHCFDGLKDTNRKLEWSLTLRGRCADAIIFLENMGLIKVTGDTLKIEVTEQGAEFIKSRIRREGDFGLLSRGLRRAVITVETKGFTLL